MLKDNIKKYRKKAGLTQKELADLSGVSYSTITKLENGILENPSLGVIACIAIVLKVKVEDLQSPEPETLNPFRQIDDSRIDYLMSQGFTSKEWQPVNSECASGIELTGTNIKKYRTAKGYTQGELAKAIGEPKVNVQRYESGEKIPSLDTIFNLADAFDVSVDDLIGLPSGDVPQPVLDEEGEWRTNRIKFQIRELISELPDVNVDCSFLESDWTKEELEEIEQFKDFIRSKRKKQPKAVEKFRASLPEAAHERTGIEVTDEMRKHDDEIMNDDDF